MVGLRHRGLKSLNYGEDIFKFTINSYLVVQSYGLFGVAQNTEAIKMIPSAISG